MNLELSFGDDGVASGVYSDELAEVFAALGSASIKRASHVEPVAGGWSADMGPVGGPVLGPFALRGEALAAEVEWLQPRVAAGVV